MQKQNKAAVMRKGTRRGGEEDAGRSSVSEINKLRVNAKPEDCRPQSCCTVVLITNEVVLTTLIAKEADKLVD